MILIGHNIDRMRELPEKSVHCVVTSPPYWRLRDYGTDPQTWGDGWMGELGSEPTPEMFVAHMAEVFAEVWRVLRDDGTCWVNLGDSYASQAGGYSETGSRGESAVISPKTQSAVQKHKTRKPPSSLKPKDLIGIPWRVAFALQAAGWYLRQDIIWCLSGGAWVYAKTAKGEMPVMVKDLVRLKPSTVKLWNGERWTQVLGWGRNPDPQDKTEIVLRSGERIGCTGTHLWPTQRGNVCASELAVGDVIQTCRLPEPDSAQSPSHFHENAAWFLGLYLAEGSRADDTIQFSLCSDELHWIPRIESVAKHYGGSLTYTVSGNSLSVRVYGRLLVALVEEYIGGSVAKDKHLKVAAWKLPNSSLREIAHGYLQGDGNFDQANGRWRLGFTRNYSLERDLRTLSARLGACLIITPCTSTSQNGEHKVFRGEWRWDRSGHWNEKDRGEIVEIRSSRARQFWDISVEDEPHLFSLASGVLTHNCKPNPMPESVRDRCTKAHEYLFLLTKSERYFFDGEACSEKAIGPAGGITKPNKSYEHDPVKHRTKAGLAAAQTRARETGGFAKRNRRSVWSISTHSYKGAHFATYPPRLVEPCILAGTSAKGCCPHCGKPWARVVESKRVATRLGEDSKVCFPAGWATGKDHSAMGHQTAENHRKVTGNSDPQRHVSVKVTTGWQQACKCEAHEPVPCTVLDPFGGSGTTAIVAAHHGRKWIICELNPQYATLAEQRIAEGWTPPKAKKPRRKRHAKQKALFNAEAC